MTYISDTRLGIGHLKLQTVDLTLQIVNSKLQVVDSKLQNADSKLQILDSKLQNLDSKLQVLDSKFQDVYMKLQNLYSKLRTGDLKLQNHAKTADPDGHPGWADPYRPFPPLPIPYRLVEYTRLLNSIAVPSAVENGLNVNR